VALLQVVEDDLHLCAGVKEVMEEDDLDDGREGALTAAEARGAAAEAAGGIAPNHDHAFADEDDLFLEMAGRHRHASADDLLPPFNEEEQQQRRGLRASFSTLKTIGSLPNWSSMMGNEGGSKNKQVLDIGNFVDSSNMGNETAQNKKQGEIHVVPSHGVPVAILAKRGQCTYETKARIASTLTSPHGTVRFVIVYDNLPGDGNHLITMMPKESSGTNEGRGRGGHLGRKKNDGHDLWKEVGMVFVSYESGVDLREFINTQSPHVQSQGGPRVLIDGSDHWVFPPMDESAAGLAFLLMLFGCVCSLSLFLNTTFLGGGRSGDSVANDHNLFFLGPDGQTTARNAANGGSSRRGRGNGLRLLTTEEVETLPTREYCVPEEPSSPNSNSLELRDKSEMPYLADEYDNDDTNEEGQQHQEQEQRDSTLHDVPDEDSPRRGLCEHLLPSTKKQDPYFDHNTCSICLDEYELGEQIRVLPCQHTFHSNCIFPWLTERSPTCPLCKAMFEAVQYEEEEEGGEDDGQEEGAGGAAGRDEAEEGVEENGQPRGDDEEQSVQTETSAALEEEPPVHRRRQQRQQRQADRQNERASRRSRRDSNANDDAEAAVSTSNEAILSSEEPSSSGLRGRLWGLFGAATTATTAANSSSALEEPLLTSDDGNNDSVV